MVKPYNHLSGEVKLITLLTQPQRNRYSADSWVQVNLYSDGLPLVDYNYYNIYLKGLKASLQGSGKYLIICCGCGYGFCDAAGELFVEVTHQKDYIEWKHRKNLPHGHYRFDKEQYRSVVEQLEEELHRYFSQYTKGKDLEKEDYNARTITTFPNELWDEWRSNYKKQDSGNRNI